MSKEAANPTRYESYELPSLKANMYSISADSAFLREWNNASRRWDDTTVLHGCLVGSTRYFGVDKDE
jgi:hypothetical protein